MSNRVANTVMLPVEEYEALKSEAADAASLRKKYADACKIDRATHPEAGRLDNLVHLLGAALDEAEKLRGHLPQKDQQA